MKPLNSQIQDFHRGWKFNEFETNVPVSEFSSGLCAFLDRLLGTGELQAWARQRSESGKVFSLSLGLLERPKTLEQLTQKYGAGFVSQMQFLGECRDWSELNLGFSRLVKLWRDAGQISLLLHLEAWAGTESRLGSELRDELRRALASLGVSGYSSENISEVVEHGLHGFLPKVFEGSLIAGMLVGGPLGFAARAQTLSGLWRFGASFGTRGKGAELISSSVGLLVESAGVLLGSRLYRGEFSTEKLSQEYRGMLLSLGLMRVGGNYLGEVGLSGVGKFLGYSFGHELGSDESSKTDIFTSQWWLERGIDFIQLELGGHLAQSIAPGIYAWQTGLAQALSEQGQGRLREDLLGFRQLDWDMGLAPASAGMGSVDAQQLQVFSEGRQEVASGAKGAGKEVVEKVGNDSKEIDIRLRIEAALPEAVVANMRAFELVRSDLFKAIEQARLLGDNRAANVRAFIPWMDGSAGYVDQFGTVWDCPKWSRQNKSQWVGYIPCHTSNKYLPDKSLSERSSLIQRLRASGISAVEIADFFGVALNYVYEQLRSPEQIKYKRHKFNASSDIYDQLSHEVLSIPVMERTVDRVDQTFRKYGMSYTRDYLLRLLKRKKNSLEGFGWNVHLGRIYRDSAEREDFIKSQVDVRHTLTFLGRSRQRILFARAIRNKVVDTSEASKLINVDKSSIFKWAENLDERERDFVFKIAVVIVRKEVFPHESNTSVAVRLGVAANTLRLWVENFEREWGDQWKTALVPWTESYEALKDKLLQDLESPPGLQTQTIVEKGDSDQETGELSSLAEQSVISDLDHPREVVGRASSKSEFEDTISKTSIAISQGMLMSENVPNLSEEISAIPVLERSVARVGEVLQKHGVPLDAKADLTKLLSGQDPKNQHGFHYYIHLDRVYLDPQEHSDQLRKVLGDQVSKPLTLLGRLMRKLAFSKAIQLKLLTLGEAVKMTGLNDCASVSKWANEAEKLAEDLIFRISSVVLWYRHRHQMTETTFLSILGMDRKSLASWRRDFEELTRDRLQGFIAPWKAKYEAKLQELEVKLKSALSIQVSSPASSNLQPLAKIQQVASNEPKQPKPAKPRKPKAPSHAPQLIPLPEDSKARESFQPEKFQSLSEEKIRERKLYQKLVVRAVIDAENSKVKNSVQAIAQKYGESPDIIEFWVIRHRKEVQSEMDAEVKKSMDKKRPPSNIYDKIQDFADDELDDVEVILEEPARQPLESLDWRDDKIGEDAVDICEEDE